MSWVNESNLLNTLARDIQTTFNLHASPESRVLDLCSETGELAKAVLKSNQYGTQAFNVTENIIEEVGDVLFALLAFCAENNINPDTAIQTVLHKLHTRLNTTGTLGSQGVPQ